MPLFENDLQSMVWAEGLNNALTMLHELGARKLAARRQRKLAEIEKAETVVYADTLPYSLPAVMSAGAYGSSMSSVYNSLSLAAEALVKGSASAIIRERGTYSDLTSMEAIPEL